MNRLQNLSFRSIGMRLLYYVNGGFFFNPAVTIFTDLQVPYCYIFDVLRAPVTCFDDRVHLLVLLNTTVTSSIIILSR